MLARVVAASGVRRRRAPSNGNAALSRGNARCRRRFARPAVNRGAELMAENGLASTREKRIGVA